ncbi:MAG: hypothetical protein KDD25_03400 [Bdellovibrionales bacterium]|nr:hypothetical protein [Bdellovibrionales bacterium]
MKKNIYRLLPLLGMLAFALLFNNCGKLGSSQDYIDLAKEGTESDSNFQVGLDSFAPVNDEAIVQIEGEDDLIIHYSESGGLGAPLDCSNVYEASDDNFASGAWTNNQICSNREIGLEFSFNGSRSNKTCVNIKAPLEKSSTWSDNFFCVNENANLLISYGRTKRPNCVRIGDSRDTFLRQNGRNGDVDIETLEWPGSYLCFESVPESEIPSTTTTTTLPPPNSTFRLDFNGTNPQSELAEGESTELLVKRVGPTNTVSKVKLSYNKPANGGADYSDFQLSCSGCRAVTGGFEIDFPMGKRDQMIRVTAVNDGVAPAESAETGKFILQGLVNAYVSQNFRLATIGILADAPAPPPGLSLELNWIQPRSRAGFGPENALIVSFTYGNAPNNTRVDCEYKKATDANYSACQNPARRVSGSGRVFFHFLPPQVDGQPDYNSDYSVRIRSGAVTDECLYDKDGGIKMCN